MNCATLQKLLKAEAKHDCFSSSTVAEEKGKKFTLNNNSGKQVCKVKVDGCLLESTSHKKCDYLFSVGSANETEFLLVELKGGDISTAVEQVVETFTKINAIAKANAQQYTGFIVSSAVPRATNDHFRKIQDKVYKKNRLMIRRSSNQYIHTI